jgi:TRAP-type C4-dicarboxylate transport system permease small subunit
LGLDLGYVYLAVPISGFFLTIYSIELLAESVRALLRGSAAVAPKTE